MITPKDREYEEIVGRVIAATDQNGWALMGNLMMHKKTRLTIDMTRTSEEEGYVSIAPPKEPQILIRLNELDARRIEACADRLRLRISVTEGQRVMQAFTRAIDEGSDDDE
jgi:hypothetical protein